MTLQRPIAFISLWILLLGCGQGNSSETLLENAPTAVSLNTLPTVTPTSTAQPTQTPTREPTSTPTPQPTRTDTPQPTHTATPTAIPENFFYVSKLGSNADGRSWETAWSEMDQVDWTIIEPGATILLDGGAEQMVYTSTLKPATNGSADAPITIRLAEEPGRDGQVLISGGRPYDLPYCDQPDFVKPEGDALRNAIRFENVAWVVVDGRKWRGIVITDTDRHGIELKPDTDHITLRNIEIYDIGFGKEGDDGAYPNGTGITLDGTNHTFERLIIHDNGHDALQSRADTLDSLTVRQSWLYNSVPHPEITDQAFNYCTHSDALQIYDGGVVENIAFYDTILGPGFTNTVILGDKVVNVNRVLFDNVLFLKGAENNVSAHSTATIEVHDWTLRNVTVFSPNEPYNAITFKGDDLTIVDSIFLGGHINIPNTEPTVSGNCQWGTTGNRIGEEVDPDFVSALPDPFSVDNYQPRAAACVGKGATIFTLDDLLGQ